MLCPDKDKRSFQGHMSALWRRTLVTGRDAHEFTGSRDLTRPAQRRKAGQLVNAVENGLGDVPRKDSPPGNAQWRLQIDRTPPLSTGSASRVKEPVDTVTYVLMFHDL